MATGYPRGVAGEAISLGGRIIAAADAFDALTSPRPYREAISPSAAIATHPHPRRHPARPDRCGRPRRGNRKARGHAIRLSTP